MIWLLVIHIHNSSWSFHEPYRSRKHIFREPYRVNGTCDCGPKPANNYQIIWQCYNIRTGITDNIFMSKSFQTSLFMKLKMKNCLAATIHHSNLYLLFDYLKHQKKYFKKLCNTCSLMKFQGISKFICSILWSPWLPYFLT